MSSSRQSPDYLDSIRLEGLEDESLPKQRDWVKADDHLFSSASFKYYMELISVWALENIKKGKIKVIKGEKYSEKIIVVGNEKMFNVDYMLTDIKGSEFYSADIKTRGIFKIMIELRWWIYKKEMKLGVEVPDRYYNDVDYHGNVLSVFLLMMFLFNNLDAFEQYRDKTDKQSAILDMTFNGKLPELPETIKRPNDLKFNKGPQILKLISEPIKEFKESIHNKFGTPPERGIDLTEYREKIGKELIARLSNITKLPVNHIYSGGKKSITVKQLQQLCAKKKIAYSGKRKAELIALLDKHRKK